MLCLDVWAGSFVIIFASYISDLAVSAQVILGNIMVMLWMVAYMSSVPQHGGRPGFGKTGMGPTEFFWYENPNFGNFGNCNFENLKS